MPDYLPYGSPSLYPQVGWADPTDATCGNCGSVMHGDVWLIIVLADDVPELIYNHTLQSLTCQNCGARLMMDAPLLVCRLGFNPPLIYSPATGTTAEQDQQYLGQFIDVIKSQIGTLWDEDWLADSWIVPRIELVSAILQIQGKPAQPAGLAPDVVQMLQQSLQGG